MSLWLSPEELIELTGYTRRSRRKMALAQMNIPSCPARSTGSRL